MTETQKIFCEYSIMFEEVLKYIDHDQETFRRMYALTYNYKNPYLPLSFLLKYIGNMCRKEELKLKKQTIFLREICDIYNSVIDIFKKEQPSIEEKKLIKVTLFILLTKINKHKEQMKSWHICLKQALEKAEGNMQFLYHDIVVLTTNN